ncbi:MAG: glycosyltransferase [Betaproteobacteria bacterium]
MHLVNPLWDPQGGVDRRTIDTWNTLRGSSHAQLWTEYQPAAAFAAAYPLRRIQPLRLSMPYHGTIVFVGVYFRIGHWIRLARPERVVVIYNTDQPDRLQKNLRRIAGCGRQAEVVVASHALNRRLGVRLPILESPVDLSRFAAVDGPPVSRPFTVGRLSRDDERKHHAEDPELYRRLAAAGCRVRIMGGTVLTRALAGIENIELLPEGAEDAGVFLRSLDCFVYRTSQLWFEGFGRVVCEAMASGLPVVGARLGGYTDYLSNEMDSLLFETTAQAFAQILRLRADPALCRKLGDAASVTARKVVGECLRRRTRELLLSPSRRIVRGKAPLLPSRLSGRPAEGDVPGFAAVNESNISKDA